MKRYINLLPVGLLGMTYKAHFYTEMPRTDGLSPVLACDLFFQGRYSAGYTLSADVKEKVMEAFRRRMAEGRLELSPEIPAELPNDGKRRTRLTESEFKELLSSLGGQ